MNMIHQRGAAWALTALGLFAAQPAYGASPGSWDDASSIARDGLVLAALGLPIFKKDGAGIFQATASIGTAFAATAGLKEALPEWRPDRSDRRSFPSGHASVSFAAAATLQNRYGWRVGIPAQAVAAFVGVARVKANKHDWADVAVGAAVGEAAGFLITRRQNSKIVVVPYADTTGGGVAAAMRF